MGNATQVDFLVAGVTNTSNLPLSGGTAHFFDIDAVTYKTIWEDSAKTVEAKNPADLSEKGTVTVYASGTYTVVTKNSAGAIQETYPSVYFPEIASSSTNTIDASLFGSGDDAAALVLAIASASGADRTVYLSPKNWDIDADLTIPSNINIKFEMGAYATVANAKTLTINGVIEAPLYNIFRVAGSGSVVIENKNNNIPSVWLPAGTHDHRTVDGTFTISDNLVIEGTSGGIPVTVNVNEDTAPVEMLRLNRTSSSPADNDTLDINIVSENDNDEQVSFGKVQLKTLDVSDGTEKGEISFHVADGVDGSVDQVLQVNIDGITVTGDVGAVDANFTGNVVIDGDLDVNGTTTTVGSESLTVDDPIIILGGDTPPVSDDNKDRGVMFRWYSGSAKTGFFGFDDTDEKFFFIPDATITSDVATGTLGNIKATEFEGNLIGTVNTAAQTSITSLGTLTALTIDNINIDGTTIGHTSDTDLIGLASGVVTVNGATIVGNIKTSSSSIGVNSTDEDLIALADNIVTVNGTIKSGITKTSAANPSHVFETTGASHYNWRVITQDTNESFSVQSGDQDADADDDSWDEKLTLKQNGELTVNTIVGTLTTAAQGNVTSLGTLTSLVVDSVKIDGNTVGHTSDTDLISLAVGTATINGTLNATSLGGTLTTAAQPNITSVGTLSSLTASGAVTGATLAGTLTTAAQTNVTSLGTLSILTVDSVRINGTQIGLTSDTNLMALSNNLVTVNGTLTATTLNGTLGTAAQTNITSVGTLGALNVSGTATAGTFSGNLSGTVTQAAQTSITSLGVLTALTVDSIKIDGANIGHTSDTDLIELAVNRVKLNVDEFGINNDSIFLFGRTTISNLGDVDIITVTNSPGTIGLEITISGGGVAEPSVIHTSIRNGATTYLTTLSGNFKYMWSGDILKMRYSSGSPAINTFIKVVMHGVSAGTAPTYTWHL